MPQLFQPRFPLHVSAIFAPGRFGHTATRVGTAEAITEVLAEFASKPHPRTYMRAPAPPKHRSHVDGSSVLAQVTLSPRREQHFERYQIKGNDFRGGRKVGGGSGGGCGGTWLGRSGRLEAGSPGRRDREVWELDEADGRGRRKGQRKGGLGAGFGEDWEMGFWRLLPKRCWRVDESASSTEMALPCRRQLGFHGNRAGA